MRNSNRVFMVLSACLFLMAGAAEALAGGKGKKKEGPANILQADSDLFKSAEEIEAEQAAAGDELVRGIDIPAIATPIAYNGRFKNYVFVALRLHIASGHDVWKLREKAHYARDDMIRAAHREDLAHPDNPEQVDAEKAREVWIAAAESVLGDGVIERVDFTSMDSKKLFGRGS